MAVLILPFKFGLYVFLFLVSSLWLKLPILCWMQVVIVDILVFFLMLVVRHLVFAQWVWCWLKVSCICPLLCWGMLLLCQICGVFSSEMGSVSYEMLFPHLLKWSCDFFLCFSLCSVLCLLICEYCTILASLGWIPLATSYKIVH